MSTLFVVFMLACWLGTNAQQSVEPPVAKKHHIKSISKYTYSERVSTGEPSYLYQEILDSKGLMVQLISVQLDKRDTFSIDYFQYDTRGRLKQATKVRAPNSSPRSYSEHFAYDRNGNLLYNNLGNRINYTYDRRGRVTKKVEVVVDSKEVVTEFSYDSTGNLIGEKEYLCGSVRGMTTYTYQNGMLHTRTLYHTSYDITECQHTYEYTDTGLVQRIRQQQTKFENRSKPDNRVYEYVYEYY